jgi:hypothetical protein
MERSKPTMCIGEQCCLLMANTACHKNGVPKFLPVKWRFVKKNTLQKVIASNISLAFHAKQYIIAFYPKRWMNDKWMDARKMNEWMQEDKWMDARKINEYWMQEG